MKGVRRSDRRLYAGGKRGDRLLSPIGTASTPSIFREGRQRQGNDVPAVDCAEPTLTDFENTETFGERHKFTTEHSYSGNAITVTTCGSALRMLAVYPSYYNLTALTGSQSIWVSRDLTSGNEDSTLRIKYSACRRDNVLVIDAKRWCNIRAASCPLLFPVQRDELPVLPALRRQRRGIWQPRRRV
ncbi:MAG: hypothetical protein ACLRSW_05540 [Christensenellaceae bacterium]